MPRLRVQAGAGASRRRGPARTESASPAGGTDHQARRLGRLPGRSGVQRGRRSAGLRTARARARGGPGLRRGSHDPPFARALPRGGRPQPLCGGRRPPGGVPGACGADSAWRLGPAGGPHGVPAAPGPGRDHAAHRIVRLPQALQANCGVPARFPAPCAPGASSQDDPGGGTLTRIFPSRPLIRALGLSPNVRVLGYVPIEDFNGYLGSLRHRFEPAVSNAGGEFRQLAAGLGSGQGRAGLRGWRLPGIAGRHLPQGACRRRRRGCALRVLEPAGLAPQPGPCHGRACPAVGPEGVQLGFGRGALCWLPPGGPGGLEWPPSGESVVPLEPAPPDSDSRYRLHPRLDGARWGRSRLRGNASHAAGEDACHHPSGRPWGPHSGNGGVSPDHAVAQDAAGLWGGARVLLRALGQDRAKDASPRKAGRSSSATSTSSTPRGTSFRIPMGISPPCSAASSSSTSPRIPCT